MSRDHYFIGLSTTGHDPSLALVDDAGKVLFAEASERPAQLKMGWGIAPDRPDIVGPILGEYCHEPAEFTIATSWAVNKFESAGQVQTGLIEPQSLDWIGGQHSYLSRTAGDGIRETRGPDALKERMDFEHHLCHAVYACHTAPFEDGICAVIDGDGDVGSISVYDYRLGKLKRLWRSWGPGSIGHLYAALTDACGFSWVRGEAWKVMGLAAFGEAPEELTSALRDLLAIEKGRAFACDPSVQERVWREIAPFIRAADNPDIEAAAPLASAAQTVFGEFVDQVLTACLQGREGSNLVLCGGCALNSSYNGTVAARFDVGAVHVPPAPADDGNAVGAALLGWMQKNPGAPLPKPQGHPAYLGSRPDQRVLGNLQRSLGGWSVSQPENSAAAVAECLAGGAIVGVMRGRAEFGPRALGNRSILADPRGAEAKDRVNREVKGRESYRPFAPVVQEADADALFLGAIPSPYMSFTLKWREAEASKYPAVVHRDGTGRLQTVSEDLWLGQALRHFTDQTGAQAFLNTSLNVMGKPIVHSVQDAIAVLATTGLDALLIDDLLIRK